MQRLRVELRSEVFQTPAVTTLATSAFRKCVCLDSNQGLLLYKSSALPLSYRRFMLEILYKILSHFALRASFGTHFAKICGCTTRSSVQLFMNGAKCGPGGNRTPDLRNANAALNQLSYRPCVFGENRTPIIGSGSPHSIR